MLPAEVRPWQEASIFSRVNGYLKSWLVDIGAHVEQDQLLAEIDTPDLDHQLEQARSQATLAQGSSQLAKFTNDKWQKLWHEGVVSELDAQNTATNQDTTKANADAFAANVRVLEQQVAFKRVTAPFPATITARNVNVADLITANNTNMEMFHIQQTNPLRIYFRVPQANVTDIRNTLLFRAQGLQVGVVKPDNKVELRDIKVGRDFGTTIEIVQGIAPSDKVILNPADSLVTGDVVRVAATPASSPAPAVAKK